jgi:putative transposase
MRENDLKARQKRRFKRTTDSHNPFPITLNLIEQAWCVVHGSGDGQEWT